MMRKARQFLFAALLVGTAVAAAAGSPAAREAWVADWRAQGLQPVASRKLDLVYARPGGLGPAGALLQVAPVSVEMRRDWQRAQPGLATTRLRPGELEQLKQQVAGIVAEELKAELAGVHAGDAPAAVLQARVLDLYVNAPNMQLAAMERTYTRSFGDMVLVAELRQGAGGPLLLGAWERPPMREHPDLRLTTRVENGIEVRAAARAWARQLRHELERLGARG